MQGSRSIGYLVLGQALEIDPMDCFCEEIRGGICMQWYALPIMVWKRTITVVGCVRCVRPQIPNLQRHFAIVLMIGMFFPQAQYSFFSSCKSSTIQPVCIRPCHVSERRRCFLGRRIIYKAFFQGSLERLKRNASRLSCFERN